MKRLRYELRAVAGLALVLSALSAAPAPARTAPHAEKGAEALIRMTNCNWTYPNLPSERQIPEFGHVLDAADSLPRLLRRPVTLGPDGVPVRLAVHQWGEGTNETVLVFIHGVLADHGTWRLVAGALGGKYDLWLVDLPGFGESDEPNPKLLGPQGYTPTAMAERVLQALQSCLAERTPQPRLVLVGHSVGGLVTLRMLAASGLRDRYQTVLSRVSGAVLFAPCDVAVHQLIPKFVQLASLPTWKASVGDGLGMIREIMAKMEVEGYCRTNRATRESVDAVLHTLLQDQHLRATKAMLRQAVPFDQHGRPIWPEIHRMEAEYRHIRVPCLIVWGDSDETLPCSMAYKLAAQVPSSRLEVLSDCKHSPQKELPEVCARLIRDFDAEVCARLSPAQQRAQSLAKK